MSCYDYALRSRKDGGLYIGMIIEVARRLREHNCEYNRSTQARIPFELIYLKEFASRKQAREHEKFLKTGRGREMLRQCT